MKIGIKKMKTAHKPIIIIGIMIFAASIALWYASHHHPHTTQNNNIQVDIANQDTWTQFRADYIINGFGQAGKIPNMEFVREPNYIPSDYELKAVYYYSGVANAYYDLKRVDTMPRNLFDVLKSGFVVMYSHGYDNTDWEDYAATSASHRSRDIITANNISVLVWEDPENAMNVQYGAESGNIQITARKISVDELEKIMRSIIENED